MCALMDDAKGGQTFRVPRDHPYTPLRHCWMKRHSRCATMNNTEGVALHHCRQPLEWHRAGVSDLLRTWHDGEIENVYYAEAVVKINRTAPDEIFGTMDGELIGVISSAAGEMYGFLVLPGTGEPDDKL